MITLITGVPGGGKTLYAVSTVLPEYLKQKFKDEDGKEHNRRALVDGIKDLVVEHELMAPSKIDQHGDLVTQGEGLANWYDWVKPGDVIIVDEVQRMWRPRGNGTKVPDHIAQLETHRHKGCDIVIITQHPMLIDQNVRRLVGRHIHMRRMWGGNRAVRYEWDHCSSPDKVSDAGKSYWPYPKDAFKYYKSAEVHTKQGGKVPLALLVLGMSAVAVPVMAYYGVTKTQALLNPTTPAQVAAEKMRSTLPAAAYQAAPGLTTAPTPQAPSVASALASIVKTEPEVSGCISHKGRCSCYDFSMKKIDVAASFCRDASYEIGMLTPRGQSVTTSTTHEVGKVIAPAPVDTPGPAIQATTSKPGERVQPLNLKS